MNNSFSTKSFFFYSSKQNTFYASLLDNMKAFFKYVNTWACETLSMSYDTKLSLLQLSTYDEPNDQAIRGEINQ